MDVRTILSRIDHTMLNPTAALMDIERHCNEALQYKTAAAYIPPCYVLRVKQVFGDALNVGTTIGFPLGFVPSGIKVEETMLAMSDGADEIDMVINICDVKNGAYDNVMAEIKAVRGCSHGKILKVIVETCYLTEQEKIELCRIVTDTGVDYIKTSTGLGPAGAALEDIELFRKHIGPDVKIKAAGGIRTLSDIEAYINAGCDRIGSSTAVALFKELGAIS
jgi:deoxyribose-phosphate aldolase